MKKTTTLLKKTFFTLCLIALCYNGYAQIKKSDWVKYSLTKARNSQKSFLGTLPAKYSVWKLSTQQADSRLYKTEEQEITLPAPNGEFETFMIKPSKVVADEVAHLYSIKTYTGYKKGDPTTLISCDISNMGFHAAVYNKENSFFIEPLDKNSPNNIIIYYKKDNIAKKFNCAAKSSYVEDAIQDKISFRTPTTKRTYRLAIAAAGEFSQQFGGTPYNTTNVLNALASGVNMINPIFLRDLGVTFTLVSNTALVYPDPNTDPFNIGDDVSATQTACDNALGSSGYDVGHMVIWASTGGVAAFQVICDDAHKGSGFSGANNSITTLWVDYVAHEIGHQFGSEHNFASQECGTSVSNFRYEPGEGSSIMSYANVCGGEVQYASGSDPFFHYASIVQMQAYINTTSCGTTDNSGNTSSPVANANTNLTIPKETPFVLVGSATDANDPSNNLTYGWQQYDGTSEAVTGSPNCNSTNAPMFRYRPPTSSNYRSFPQYSDIIAGNNDKQWEKLPCTARTMNFSLTVRDNNASFGRTGEDKALITVANTGPFNVISPNGGETLAGNDSFTVTWAVNNTNTHCSNVDILVSTDGGQTYTVVMDATANDGTESITIPNTATTTARILVRCDVADGFRSASTFFDVSNANFTINSTLNLDNPEALGISVYPNPATSEIFIKLSNSENYSYELTDVRGRKILTGKFDDSNSISINNLQSGIYFLTLYQKSSNRRAVKKMIIHN